MKGIKSFIRIIQQLYTILKSGHRKKILIVFISMLFSSALELIGVSSIYPLLRVMTNAAEARQKWYVDIICGFFTNITDIGLILFFVVLIMVIFIVKNGLALWFVYIKSEYAERVQADISIDVLTSLYSRPYDYFVTHNSSELLRALNSDISDFKSVLLGMLQIFQEILTVIAIAVFLAFTDWKITMGSLFLAVICFCVILIGLKKRIKSAGRECWQLQSRRNQYALQAINGVKEIYVANRREYFQEQYATAAREYEKTQLFYDVINAIPERVIEGVCVSGFMGLACIRIYSGVNLDAFIPSLGAFAMGAFRVLPLISKISAQVNSMIFQQPGLESCHSFVVEAKKINGKEVNDKVRADESVEISDSLTVNNVTWRYVNSDVDVLKNVSIKVNKGESVAIVGPSGAGKTTLADIILGLYIPGIGNVEIDGRDISLYGENRSRLIGYIPQAVYLIDDTIRANVAFGIKRELVSDDVVWKALRQAQLADYIKNLPNGLDTMVGERGIRFSGGQRQRIAIARALYDNPEILVLDEATSALDTETETAVMESIDNLKGNKTLIIIAHRLTTIKNCDRAYEIRDGEAVERKVSEYIRDR